MNLRLVLVAIIALVVGFGLAMVYPASAQQSSEKDAWEIAMSDRDNGAIVIIKHNHQTQQTLVLTCQPIVGCSKKDTWLELPIEVVK